MTRKYREQPNAGIDLTSPKVQEGIWNEYKNPKEKILALDVTRMPADALAFYRPFHFSPYEEWGIYIMADRLLHHCMMIYRAFAGKLYAFNLETLISYVLFEVFHHEFFHHLVESAATTIEILSIGFGKPKAIYVDYLKDEYTHETGLGEHPHNPLEEALANAYAYNSFSFLSRVKVGYRILLVKLYQAMLQKSWPYEASGYNSAIHYIGPGYVSGAAQLLAMLVCSHSLDPYSARLLAKNVLLSGHTAFAQKPEIPTYFVGSVGVLAEFDKLVPAPNETYTSLFWPGDTAAIDQYLQDRRQQEKKSKPSKEARKRTTP
ncbi:MAG: hypothetical protein HY347_06385 [candidate division NC10 bacterium]|nr:hypothetical protein [candidate division NC10 bacterium]